MLDTHLDRTEIGGQLAVAIHPHRAQVVVAPKGEIDLLTVDLLERELAGLREVGFDDIVVDLRGVEFLDSSGLRLLLAETRAAEEQGHRFRLVHGPAPIRRLFEITGTTSTFRFVERPPS